MEITIVENLQRADLNPMEQARAFDRLSREFHMTQEQMAVRTGKDRASVANFLRLLRLPASVQARVEVGELSFGHARTLLAFEHPEEIEKAAKRVVDLSLSVRQTETYVQGLMHPDRAAKKDKKPEQPVDPTFARSSSGFSAPLASKSALRTTTAAVRLSSTTPAWKTSTRCWSSWQESESGRTWIRKRLNAVRLPIRRQV